ncbi:MAG: hypothetical protein PVS3B1_16590 [Ktedonobacteraceae bacterium]
MPFTAHDLRYHAEQSYPSLYGYLHRNAQRYLSALKYDAFEVDTVIGHVVEQLVRLGLLGGEDHTPLTALDRLTDAQFYTFLSHSVRNKAIDRLRKRRLQINFSAELEAPDEDEGENNPLNDAVESLWGTTPFSTPEEITLHIATQRDLLNVLKHCIMALRAAPNQLQAVIQELQDVGADDLLQTIQRELEAQALEKPRAHMSQHKDHAHKKLRNCLQQRSSNLAVVIALRLTLYTQFSKEQNDYAVDIQTLAQNDLSIGDVEKGLRTLVNEGLIAWHETPIVRLSTAQLKHLSRFYKEE